jgi:hypothetical protein
MARSPAIVRARPALLGLRRHLGSCRRQPRPRRPAAPPPGLISPDARSPPSPLRLCTPLSSAGDPPSLPPSFPGLGASHCSSVTPFLTHISSCPLPCLSHSLHSREGQVNRLEVIAEHPPQTHMSSWEVCLVVCFSAFGCRSTEGLVEELLCGFSGRFAEGKGSLKIVVHNIGDLGDFSGHPLQNRTS